MSNSSNEAQIKIFDMSGKMIKEINVDSGEGEGEVTINAGTLPASTYSYSLYLGGVLVETKQMVLTR